ncbi:MAG: hypothetical protein JW782_06690 [Candidatus Saganbacteria bacterium]|nr:hypothetical protein [Candidatus Saganbacteria bacterium]
MAIFYKELLKQSIKAPSFGVEEGGNTFTKTFTNDLMVEQLALELAKSKSLSAGILPADIERNM